MHIPPFLQLPNVQSLTLIELDGRGWRASGLVGSGVSICGRVLVSVVVLMARVSMFALDSGGAVHSC